MASFSRMLLLCCFCGLFVQCKGPTKEQEKPAFDATLQVDFQTPTSEMAMRLRNKEQLQAMVSQTLWPAVQKGALKAYRSDSFEKRFPLDSMDQEAVDHQYFKFYTQWQLQPEQHYGYLKVRAVAYPSGHDNSLFFMRPAAVYERLDSAQVALLRKAYYPSALGFLLRSNPAHSIVPAYQRENRQTVRMFSSDFDHPVFSHYVSRHFGPLNAAQFEAAKQGEIPVYAGPNLKQKLSDSRRQRVFAKDSNQVAYRPDPVEQPRLTRDTILVEPLTKYRVHAFIVAEQWHPLTGTLLDFKPNLKAIAPVVKYPSKSKTLYWIKAADFNQLITAEESRWFKTYLLHLLQAETGVGFQT